MSWDSWADQLLGNGVAEAAIWGNDSNPSVWSCKGEILQSITAAEIKLLTSKDDMKNAFTTGLRIGGKRCTLIRNEFDSDFPSLTLNMKLEDGTRAVCISKSEKAYLIVVTEKDVKGPQVLNRVYDVTDKLKKQGF